MKGNNFNGFYILTLPRIPSIFSFIDEMPCSSLNKIFPNHSTRGALTLKTSWEIDEHSV